MNYLIWEHTVDDRLCSLNPLENVENAFELSYGVSRIDGFPPDASFRMNPEYKKAIKLSDALDNIVFLIVASKRLKEFFEMEKLINIEYLSVTIFNHKNRIASDEYYIVHQVGTQDCIDQEKSDFDWNIINPDQISSVDHLVLDESKVDPNAKLFRAKHLPSTIFIRKDLAEKIEATGFTGIRFEDIDSFEKV